MKNQKRKRQKQQQRKRKRKFLKICRDITIGGTAILFATWLMWFMVDLIVNAPGLKGKNNGTNIFPKKFNLDRQKTDPNIV